jgi:hypothetical protein
MYIWLDEILAHWRSQGRRPATTFGREFLSLEPGQLRNLVEAELNALLSRDSALLSQHTVKWSAAAAIAACWVMGAVGTPILDSIVCVVPSLLVMLILWTALQWILGSDSTRLNTLLDILPEFDHPAYVNALLPLLKYHPGAVGSKQKTANNDRVENRLIFLLERIEPSHLELWDGRDWMNFRSLFVRSPGSARLTLAALQSAERIGGAQILSAVRNLAAGPEDVFRTLRVREPESEHICAAARAVVRRIEARLAEGREAAVLLRPSHVKDVVLESDLVRPVGLHERTPVSQLLRTPAEKSCDGSELLRVHNGK